MMINGQVNPGLGSYPGRILVLAGVEMFRPVVGTQQV
jgi:hypothetical protein